jgi:hypothetical protein
MAATIRATMAKLAKLEQLPEQQVSASEQPRASGPASFLTQSAGSPKLAFRMP